MHYSSFEYVVVICFYQKNHSKLGWLKTLMISFLFPMVLWAKNLWMADPGGTGLWSRVLQVLYDASHFLRSYEEYSSPIYP